MTCPPPDAPTTLEPTGRHDPDEHGWFGAFGGRFVPETLVAALEELDETPLSHLVGVVAFDDEARVLTELGTSRALARAAITGLVPRAHRTQYPVGLAAASTLIGDRTGRIIVVPDRQESGWAEGTGGLAAQIAVEVRAVDPPRSNVAVVDIQADSNGAEAVLLRVGTLAGETEVSLAVEGQPVVERRVTLGSCLLYTSPSPRDRG